MSRAEHNIFIAHIISFFFLYCVLQPTVTFSQDIHFSQFYASPLTLNPANTGNYIGDWRFANIFRRQWSSIVKKKPFQTIGLSYDQQFYILSEKISLGFLITDDRSSPFNLVGDGLYLSAAYHKTIAGNNFHFGFQGGYAFKSIGKDMAETDDFNPQSGQFESTFSTTNTSFEKKSFVDLNTGVIWGRKFGKFEPEAGFALYHFNAPKQSLIKDDNGKLPLRPVFHYGGRIILTDKIFLMPNILIMGHKKAKDYVEGINLAYRLPKNAMKIAYLYGGLQARNGIKRNNDAVIAVVGAQFAKLNVGLSYDVNVSDLKAGTNYRGGFEVSIIYIAPSTLLQNVSIPCDRD